MSRFSSMFSQLLNLLPRTEFQALVNRTYAEQHARGFTCWGQSVAMLFCQLGRAHSLREICGGLASCEGKRVSRKGRRVQWEGRPTGARARRPVAWMAGRRETEALKPIDEPIGRIGSELPGRNVSERRGGPENASPGGRACACHAKAAGTVAVWLTRRLPSGGVRATARWPGHVRQLEKSSSSRREIGGAG